MMTSNNNNNSKNNDDSDISTLVVVEQYMSIYGPFVLTSLGIIGNILSILVFLSSRFRRQSSHFYLLSLALSDLCFLIINLVEDTFRNHNDKYHSKINILDRTLPIVCIFVQYARNVTRLLSSWIVVAFTVERLLVVFYPLKRATICRRKIARRVVAILCTLSFLVNINVPFHYGIISETGNPYEPTICDILPGFRSIYMRFAIASMIMVYLVPMCTIGIVNMLICCKLGRRNFLIEKDDSTKRKIEEGQHRLIKRQRRFYLADLFSRTHSSSTATVNNEINKLSRLRISTPNQQSMGSFRRSELSSSQINGHLSKIPLKNQSRLRSNSNVYVKSLSNPSQNQPQSSTWVKAYIQSRANRVTATLLLVSCSFLLLNTPYCAIWLVNYAQGFRNATLKSIKEITELFMLTNFCINFLLYCVSGTLFRGELLSIIRCRCGKLYDRNDADRLSPRKSRRQLDFPLRCIQKESLPLPSYPCEQRRANSVCTVKKQGYGP